MAKLCGAMEVALSFAKDQGYITNKLYEIRRVKAYQAFQTVFEHNISSLVNEKPSRKFLNAMGEIMQQIPERFCETTTHVASQDVLGCYDEKYLYLLPTASFKAVQEHTSATGNSFPVGDKALWKHLRAEGIIETSNSRARNTVQLRFNCFGGRNVDVLKIERKHFEITE